MLAIGAGLFTPVQQHAILRVKNSYHLLSVIINKSRIHDALALRYRKPLFNLPPFCDDSDATFSEEHALECCVGGLVVQHHNEV